MFSENQNPLVSIFIPAYNAEKFIIEAIETALNQTYENVELVISDDASTDKTWELIKPYADNYPSKVKAFRQEKNLGVTANCNFLLNHCSGEYICFSAGDDFLAVDCIEKSLIHFKNHDDLGIVFHKYNMVDEYSNAIPLQVNLIPHVGDIRDFLKKGIYFMVNGMIVKKAANPNLSFNPELKFASDHEIIFDILAHKNSKFYYTHEVGAYYRMNAMSLTKTKIINAIVDAFVSNYNLSLKYESYAKFIKEILISCIDDLKRHKFLGLYEYFFYRYIFLKTDTSSIFYSFFKFFKEKFVLRLKKINQ